VNRLPVALSAALLALVPLAGCGGGAGNDEPAADAPASSAAPSSSEPSPSPGSPKANDAAPGAGTKYCDLLGSDLVAVFDAIKGPRDAARAVGIVEKIAQEAPEDIRGDWAVLSASLDQVQVSLTKAAQLQEDARSGKLSQAEARRAIMKLIKQNQALATPKTQAAGKAVADHAGAYCGLSFGG
jgi:hypothetical protein